MSLPTRVSRALAVDPMEVMQREFDSVFGRLLGGTMMEGTRGWAPYAVDVREDADHLYVEAELPGYRKEDIDVTLENQTLTISAERKEEHAEIEGEHHDEFLLKERRYNRFMRSFTLPPTVDDQTVNAKLMDGILKITLNKREETKPRKVQVS